MIGRFQRSPLTYYKPLWGVLALALLGTGLASAAALVVLFGLFPPEGWRDLSLPDRLGEAWQVSRALGRNAIIDGIHASLLYRLHVPDPIGDLDFDDLRAAIGQRWHVTMVTVCLTAGPIIWLSSLLTPRMRDARHTDGPRLIEGPAAHRRARRALRAALKRGHTIDLAPSVPLPKEREVRSIVLLGGQRSGKTVVMRSMMRQVLNTRAKMIVHDTKGDVTSDWPSDDVISFAPHDKRSWGWDIGNDVVGVMPAFELAAAFVPESEKEPQWAQGAQQILTAVFVALQRQHGTAWGWGEIYATLQQSPVTLYELARDHHPVAMRFLALENGEFTRTSDSYVTTLVSPLARVLQPLAAAWGDLHPDYRVSLRRWAADDYEGPRTIILQRTPAYPETSRMWMSAVVSYLIANTGGSEYKNSDSRRLWLFLDEFPQMGKVKPLLDVPGTHAAKGVTLVLAFQSLGQVKDVYGPNVVADLAQLTGTKIVFRTQGEDARYVSETLVGSWRYSAPERSAKRGGQTWLGDDTVSWRTHEQAVLLPSYLSSLVPTTAGVDGLVIGLDGGDVYRLSWPYEKWPEQRPAGMPAEWISKLPQRPGVAQANTP